MKKLLLTILIIFNLSACSTLEVVHNPVGCIGQPMVSFGFTSEEVESLSESVKKKIIIFARTLRGRIDAQCAKNKNHDKIHETHSKY